MDSNIENLINYIKYKFLKFFDSFLQEITGILFLLIPFFACANPAKLTLIDRHAK